MNDLENVSLPESAEDAINALRENVVEGRTEEMAAYHKVDRSYLGVPNPVLNDLATAWRRGLPFDSRVALARDLWASDIFEARVTAAKLLTQARIKDDGEVWDLIVSWVPEFVSWAIADHVASAGGRRLTAHPERLDEVEGWTTSDHMWTRRAAFVFTLPFGKSRHPSETEIAARERVLGWAVHLASDPEWFVQKAIAWWLRDLSRHAPGRVHDWLAEHGDALKPFARKEAARHLP